MLQRGASASRALARAASAPRPMAASASAVRAASSISIGAGGVLKVPNDPIIPFIEARGDTQSRRGARCRSAPRCAP